MLLCANEETLTGRVRDAAERMARHERNEDERSLAGLESDCARWLRTGQAKD
jgi:hypothetical protein